MTQKTRYMIAANASVVVVRGGERKTIQPGGGADFTEDEITAINRQQPGCLRAPVVERRPSEDADADEAPGGPAKAAKKKPKGEKKTTSVGADDDEDI